MEVSVSSIVWDLEYRGLMEELVAELEHNWQPPDQNQNNLLLE